MIEALGLSMQSNVRGLIGSSAMSPEIKSLFELSTMSVYGPGSYAWISGFRELGILHLLVLSGTQVSRFLSLVDSLLGCAGRLWGRGDSQLGRLLIVLGSGCIYGAASGFQPPLVRALLVYALVLFAPRLRWEWVGLMGLALHVFLWGEHMASVGFFLSWLSWWLLIWLSERSWPRWCYMLLLSAVCHVLVVWALGLSWPTASGWALILSANLCVGYVFDRYLMPLCGWVLVFGLFMCFAPDIFVKSGTWAVGGILAPFLNGAAQVVIVVTKAFRYI